MSIDGFDFTVISNGRIDPDSPLSTDLFTDMRDNMEFLKLWLGKTFVGAAVADHNHDGTNSKKIVASDVTDALGAFVWVDDGTKVFTDVTNATISGLVSISSQVPVGTSSAQIFLSCQSPNTATLSIRDNGAGTYRQVVGAVTAETNTTNVLVPVNSSRQMDRSSVGGGGGNSTFFGEVRGYFGEP